MTRRLQRFALLARARWPLRHDRCAHRRRRVRRTLRRQRHRSSSHHRLRRDRRRSALRADQGLRAPGAQDARASVRRRAGRRSTRRAALARVLQDRFRARAHHGEVRRRGRARGAAGARRRATSISSSSMRRPRPSSRWPPPCAAATCCCSTSRRRTMRCAASSARARSCIRCPSLAHEHGRPGAISGRRANGATILVLQGPLPADALMTQGVRAFGARSSARASSPSKQFKPGTDPREREQNNPALLTRRQPRLRRGLRRRRRLRFRPPGALPHRAAAAGGRQHRSRAGGLALDLGAQRRAAGQLPLREAHRRPPHGKRRLGGLDGGEDGGASRRCARARPISRSSAISSSAARSSTATRASR